jgi:uncharacterized heparinase superfamily protein
VALGKAYAFTGDERYAREFAAQVTSWLASNPPGFGVNWAGTMEVAIRAVNWLWAYHFFEGAATLTPDFYDAFLNGMDAHGRHIIRDLETYWPPTNHLIANFCGLVYLGVMFPELKESRRWLRRGLRGLFRQLVRQTYRDGLSYEASLGYHRFVTELILSPVLLLRLNGIPVPDAALARLEKMLEAIRAYTQPDGLAPLIGDADDSRLHVLTAHLDRLTQAHDHRHLLAVGAVLFDRPDMAAAAGDQWEDALWFFGERVAAMKAEAQETQPESTFFPGGGLTFMRHEGLYLSLDAGPNGQGRAGGHAHNDILSITVSAHGRPFLVDPGTCAYTGDVEARNAFRSTSAHNTLQVDGQEINRFDAHDLFRLYDDATPTIHRWQSTPEYDLLDAAHDGYVRLPGRVIHRRQVFFDKREGFWLLRDVVRGEGEHDLVWGYHFAPLRLEAGPGGAVVASYEDGAGLLILPLEPADAELSLSEGWISPAYGVRLPAPLAKYTRRAILPAIFAVVLYPYHAEGPPLDLARAAGKRALAHMEHETSPL